MTSFQQSCNEKLSNLQREPQKERKNRAFLSSVIQRRALASAEAAAHITRAPHIQQPVCRAAHNISLQAEHKLSSKTCCTF
jgi:hypothetical protein